MKMKICLNCNKEFQQHLKLNGKSVSLQKRKFCLECSPYKDKTKRKIRDRRSKFTHSRDYQKMSDEEKKLFNSKTSVYTQIRRQSRKSKLIESKGGKCSICGYNKNYAALHFHHINPQKKLFNLDCHQIASKSWESIELEAKKCILLCSNCHAEHHNPQCRFENVIQDYSI